MLGNTTLFIDALVTTTIGKEERDPKTKKCDYEVCERSTNWSVVIMPVELRNDSIRKRFLRPLQLLFSIEHSPVNPSYNSCLNSTLYG